MRLFRFNRANLMFLTPVWADDCTHICAYWLNGRIFGRYISLILKWPPIGTPKGGSA